MGGIGYVTVFLSLSWRNQSTLFKLLPLAQAMKSNQQPDTAKIASIIAAVDFDNLETVANQNKDTIGAQSMTGFTMVLPMIRGKSAAELKGQLDLMLGPMMAQMTQSQGMQNPGVRRPMRL